MKHHLTARVSALTISMLITACSAMSSVAVVPPEVLWDRTYGDGLIHSVAETFDGGVIATGYWYDPYRIMLLRTDPNGDTLWTRSLMQGQGHSVLQTADGGFAVGGEESPAIPRDRFLRFNSAGDTLWTRTYGNGTIHSILEMSNGDFILCGSNGDVTLRRVNSQGQTIWFKSYGIPNGDVGYSVDQTSDGGFIVGGSTRRGCSCSSDAWVLRMNAVGDTLWTWKYNGPDSTWDIVFSIKSAPGGSIFTGQLDLGGSWVGRLDDQGDTLWIRRYSTASGGEITELSQGGYMFCVRETTTYYPLIYRLNTDGDSLWAMYVGGFAYDQADYLYSIKQTTDGGFIAGGNRDFGLLPGGPPPNAWLIRLGPEQTTSDVGDDSGFAVTARLSVFPNPARARTAINYQVPAPGFYSLVVYDVRGRRVRQVEEGFRSAGYREVAWDGHDDSGEPVGSGIYYVHLRGPGVSLPAKLVLRP